MTKGEFRNKVSLRNITQGTFANFFKHPLSNGYHQWPTVSLEIDFSTKIKFFSENGDRQTNFFPTQSILFVLMVKLWVEERSWPKAIKELWIRAFKQFLETQRNNFDLDQKSFVEINFLHLQEQRSVFETYLAPNFVSRVQRQTRQGSLQTENLMLNFLLFTPSLPATV